MDLTAGHAGIHADGIIRIVLELKVQRTPVDGGVHSGGNIVDQVTVFGTLHDLQISQHGCVVDGGSNLADAAAHTVFGGFAHIDGSALVTLFLSTLTHDPVEGESLAGTDDGAVDGIGSQSQVVGTVGIVNMVGVHLSQNILEQVFFQLRLGDLSRQEAAGELQLFAGLYLCQQLCQCLQFKAITQDLRGHNVGFFVQNGINRFHKIVCEQLLQIHCIGLHHGVFAVDGAKIVCCIGIQDLLHQCFGVQMAVGGTHGEGHHDMCHVFVFHGFFIYPIQSRNFALQMDLSLGEHAFSTLGQLFHHLTDVVSVDGEVVQDLQLVGGQRCGSLCLGPFPAVAGTAVGECIFHQPVQIHGNLRITGTEDQRGIRQFHGQILFCIVLFHQRGQNFTGLLGGHAAQIYIKSINIAVDQTVILGHIHVPVNADAGCDHQHSGHNCSTDANDFIAFLFGVLSRDGIILILGVDCFGTDGNVGRFRSVPEHLLQFPVRSTPGLLELAFLLCYDNRSLSSSGRICRAIVVGKYTTILPHILGNAMKFVYLFW